VFHNSQTALMISGGGGSGVAIENSTGQRTYMRMISGGIGVGLGFQMMDVVFMFETAEKFKHFVEGKWDAGSSANSAVASAGANAGASFTDGIAVFQMTDKGLIAQAAIKGTKYWSDDKLNGKKKDDHNKDASKNEGHS